MVEVVLHEISPPQQQEPPRRERTLGSLREARHVIEHAVRQVFDVAADDFAAVNRGVARTAQARQVAMYLAHVAWPITLTDVGRMFGRDRTTVAHACAVVEDERDDPSFDRALDLLEWAVTAMARRRAGE